MPDDPMNSTTPLPGGCSLSLASYVAISFSHPAGPVARVVAGADVAAEAAEVARGQSESATNNVVTMARDLECTVGASFQGCRYPRYFYRIRRRGTIAGRY